MGVKCKTLAIATVVVGVSAGVLYVTDAVQKRTKKLEWMTKTELGEGYIALGEKDYDGLQEEGLTRYIVQCNDANVLSEESVRIIRYSGLDYTSTHYDDGVSRFYGDADSKVDVIEKGVNGGYPHTRLVKHRHYSSNKEEFDAANEALLQTRERFKSRLFELGKSESGKEYDLLACINKIPFKTS